MVNSLTFSRPSEKTSPDPEFEEETYDSDIEKWDFMAEPLHSRLRFFDFKSNTEFSENNLFKTINKKLHKRGFDELPIDTIDLFSWVFLRYDLLLFDSYAKHPFIAVKNYTQINSLGTSFSTNPFMFVTAALSNIEKRGLAPFLRSNTYIYRSRFFGYIKGFIQLPINIVLKSLGYEWVNTGFNLITSAIFYYFGYQSLKTGIATRYLLGNYNSSEASFESLNITPTSYSINGFLTCVRGSNITFCYVRDMIMDSFIKYLYYNFTKPLLLGKLKVLWSSSIDKKTDSLLPDYESSDGSDFDYSDDNNDEGSMDFRRIARTKNLKNALEKPAKNDTQITMLVNKFVISVLSMSLANIISQWIFYPMEAVLVKQIYLETASLNNDYPRFWDSLLDLLKTGNLFKLYSSLPFAIVSDLFCFIGMFEVTQISANLLLKLTKPTIEKSLF